jgi:hypothetical protein
MWLIGSFRVVQLMRGSLLVGYPAGLKVLTTDRDDLKLFGFSLILAGTSIELSQKRHFPYGFARELEV